jgi:peptide/nickel transport system permease protein
MRTAVLKLVRLLIVVVVVTFLSFWMLSLEGNDVVNKVAPFSTPEAKERIAEENHLNDPFFEQYARWLVNFVQGDFGQTYTGAGQSLTGVPVSDSIWDRLGVSAELMLYAQVLALIIAVPWGVLSAYKNGSLYDKGSNVLAFAMLAMPAFLVALLLIIYVAIDPSWMPFGLGSNVDLPTQYTGVGDFPYSPLDPENIRQLALPTISLTIAQIAIYMRLLRSDMIATLQEDFITTAKAKGIPARRILFRHALRPSSLTLLTVAGLNVGALIGGAIVVERIFNLPGVGSRLAETILGDQLFETQALIAVIAVIYVLINFFVDILYTILDPRIRHARAVT